MKICMMTNTYLPHVGGVARSVHTFSEVFRRRRHQVLVVAPNYPGDEALPERVEKNVVRLPAIQQFNGSDFSVRLPLTWMVDPKLQAFAPDIVHSHHPYLIGDSALRYAADKNAPVIFTHHTLYEEYTHYVPFDSPAMKQFVIELSTQYANLCDAVIAPSESIAQLIRERGVTTPIEIIPTCIEVKSFASGRRDKFREKHGFPENAFVVGHVSRLAPEKNLDYLARGLCEFLKRNNQALVLTVGDGPSAQMFSEIFEKENLADRLLMAGKKMGRDLYDAYAAMDVFAFASQTETQGLVVAEAMAAGLPVVALDASGVREVVHDGRNGFLLRADASEADFAEALNNLATDDALRARFSAEAKQTATMFSCDEIADKALALYRRVLRKTLRARTALEDDQFKSLLHRIEVEWTLVSEKAGAVLKAIAPNTARFFKSEEVPATVND
jgi:1,2-diacylglycerol 3-alpha-glucosyltransferase